ncbi:Myc-type, basic helix-loop-helix domain-containing protein [Tanacetum coccineum]
MSLMHIFGELRGNAAEFFSNSKFIKGVRLPDGFGSNFKKKVTADDNNITGLKSHDCHIMMHRLLPYGVQRYLPKDISTPIIELCLFFKQLCARTLFDDQGPWQKLKTIDQFMIELEQDVVLWMYPFERYMKKLKNYVRNKAKPEGSIAEGYVAEEALTFCSRYLKDVETRLNLGVQRTSYHSKQRSIKHPKLNGRCIYGQLEEFEKLTYIGHQSDQDVIHGSNSSDVALSVGLTVLESTDLSINTQSTEVDTPPVNEDNANANEDNADVINNEDDVIAHVLDDDDVEVSDDDEVNPSTNVEEMACVAPRSHGGDAGGDPPRRPTGPIPAQCQGSTIRGVTTNRALRRAFRDNREEPLTVGFDIEDQGTFHPLGVNASYLNSLMGEQIRPLPLACEWEEIPPAYKAHILPTLESYFNLAEWYNRQDKVVVDDNVYTVGERVRLGLELKLRLLWRKRKTRIKAEHFKIHETPDDAKAHMPPPKVWDDRTQEDWEELVDWWSHPDRVARSVQNAANRAKNTIVTHQGKKPFVQGRQEYKAKKGYYEDLIETWRKGHSKKNGQFKTEENKARYEEMKAMKDHIRAGIIPFKTDQEILDEIVPSNNRQNMSGRGRKLLGGGLTSRRYANRAFRDVMSREQITQLYRQEQQEKELYRKQAEEAQARAWLAAQKADAAHRRADQTHDILGQFFWHYNSPNSAGPFNPSTSSHVPVPDPMPQLTPQWLYLLQSPFPFNQPLQPPFPYS